MPAAAPRIQLYDTFALTPDELKALQEEAAHTLGLPGIRFRDDMGPGLYGPELMVIPPGLFEMGAPREELRLNDQPRRGAFVSVPFALGRYAVTTEEFEVFGRATGWTPRRELVWLSGRYPVINVRKDEAEAYCAWLSRKTGQRYRLPTEEEWEFACRAGTATAYFFGDRVHPDLVHYNGSAGFNARSGRSPGLLSRCFFNCRAVEVGSLPANLWGLHEMHGNVWEFTTTPWVWGRIPHYPVTKKAVVSKGGSWFDPPEAARSAARRPRLLDELDLNLGFRVVREIA